MTGLLSTIVALILSLVKEKRKSRLRFARFTFLTTILLTLIITGIEFLLYPINKKNDQLILTGFREAPIGGYWLGIYNDSTWEIGNSSREIEIRGTYTVMNDTVTLYTTGETTFYNGTKVNQLIISKNRLVEVENTGIRYFEVGLNKLNNPKGP
ncbi:hypothetical protein [Roseivirga pacifica]